MNKEILENKKIGLRNQNDCVFQRGKKYADERTALND